MKTDLNSIESNINKVLKNFGLDNVDVKIYKNNNGKKECDHVYTKNGETKHEHTEGDAASKEIDDWTSILNDSFKTFNKKMEDFNNIFGNSLENIFTKDSAVLKHAYNTRGEEYLNKIIDNAGNQIMTNPFIKAIMDIHGLKYDKDTINKECEKLKKYVKDSCEKENNKKEEVGSSYDTAAGVAGSCSVTKADILKSSLMKEAEDKKKEEREKQRRKKVVINALHDAIVEMITHRNFQLLKDDLDHPEAGISLFIDEDFLKNIKIYNESFKFDVTNDNIEEVGRMIKDEYKFSKFNIDVISTTKMKLIFYFN